MKRVRYFPPPAEDLWRQCAPQLVKRMREIADIRVLYRMRRIYVQISGRRQSSQSFGFVPNLAPGTFPATG
jgi:hypothetical protein